LIRDPPQIGNGGEVVEMGRTRAWVWLGALIWGAALEVGCGDEPAAKGGGGFPHWGHRPPATDHPDAHPDAGKGPDGRPPDSDGGAPGDAGGGSPPPEEGGPLLKITAGATSSSAHVVLQDVEPPPGPRQLFLAPMSEQVVARADGAPVPVTTSVDPGSADVVASMTVPDGTRLLRVEYDLLDAALTYEGEWYLEHPAVSGPRHVLIALPSGAAVDRSNHVDADPAPDRVAYDLTPAESIAPFVVYRTTAVPDLNDHLDTPHFQVTLPIAHRRYQAAVLGLLENLYARYAQDSGQDENTIQGGRYPFAYPPGGWLWGDVPLSGGLSVKGVSTVNARLVPQIGLSTAESFNLMVAITAHEMGNGWWGLWEEPDLSNRTPDWINNEGHSSFLRSEGELDLGYCADARREYQGLYQEAQLCGAPGGSCGQATAVLLTSFKAHYGPGPLAAFYAAVQDRQTFQLRGLSETERASVVIGFLADQVGNDLTAFFDGFQVPMTQEVHLACRPDTLRAAIQPLAAVVPDDQASQLREYVCAPGGFDGSLSPAPGLALAPIAPAVNCGVVDLSVDPGALEPAAHPLLTLTAPGRAGSPLAVPIALRVAANLAADPGFDQDLGAPWREVAFIVRAGLFSRDLQPPPGRSGPAALITIAASEENDARLAQTFDGRPNTWYRLSGWIRTEGVIGGAGANLTIEWPGFGWRASPGIYGTTDWQRVSVDALLGDTAVFEIQARLGHYSATSTGRAWFDDIRLEELSPN
jgi:hypothetical protein